MQAFHGGQSVHAGQAILGHIGAGHTQYFSTEQSVAESYANEASRQIAGAKPQVTPVDIDTSQYATRDQYRDILNKVKPDFMDYHPSEAAALDDPKVRAAVLAAGFKGVDGAWDFGFRHDFDEVQVIAALDPSTVNVRGLEQSPSQYPQIDIKTAKQVGPQMGSNSGGVYELNGKKYYIKLGKSAAHVKNEMIAARLYQLAGAPTLPYAHVEGGTHIATEMVHLDKQDASKFSPAEIKQAQADFATHAWLANWDVAGLTDDNLGMADGKVVALDLGGALEYRAQGAPKGSKFGTSVGEMDTLRNASLNPQAARIFGKMTPAQISASAAVVAAIPDAGIKAAVAQEGGSAALADKLIARKNDIAVRFAGGKLPPAAPAPTKAAKSPGPVTKLSGDAALDAAWNDAQHNSAKLGAYAAVLQSRCESVAKSMKLDPARVSTSTDNSASKFGVTLGVTDTAGTGVTMFARVCNPKNYAGVLAHEITHIKYTRFREAYKAEKAQVDALSPADRASALLVGKYPIYQEFEKAFDKDALQKEGGVSNYSNQWWDKTKDGHWFSSAVYETLAEMARKKLETGTLPGGPRHQALYAAMEKYWTTAHPKGWKDAIDQFGDGTVVWLDDDFEPTSAEDATLAKIIYDAGAVEFARVDQADELSDFNPNHEPAGSPDGGRFASAGGGGGGGEKEPSSGRAAQGESDGEVGVAIAAAKAIVAGGVDPEKHPDQFWGALSAVHQNKLTDFYGGGGATQKAMAQFYKPAVDPQAKFAGMSKQGIVATLLQKPEGTTVKEVLAATGWTKVGMPHHAAVAGLKLIKSKGPDGGNVYKGLPMTASEMSEAKMAAKAAKSEPDTPLEWKPYGQQMPELGAAQVKAKGASKWDDFIKSLSKPEMHAALIEYGSVAGLWNKAHPELAGVDEAVNALWTKAMLSTSASKFVAWLSNSENATLKEHSQYEEFANGSPVEFYAKIKAKAAAAAAAAAKPEIATGTAKEVMEYQEHLGGAEQTILGYVKSGIAQGKTATGMTQGAPFEAVLDLLSNEENAATKEKYGTIKKAIIVTSANIKAEAADTFDKFKQSLEPIEEATVTSHYGTLEKAYWGWAEKIGKTEPPPAAAAAPPTLGKATAAELEAAKKTTPFYPVPESEAGKSLVVPFNAAYSGKVLTDPAELELKVANYKTLKAQIAAIEAKAASATQAEKAAAAAKAQAAYEAAHKAEIAKQKAAEAEADAALADIVYQLGCSKDDAKAVTALVNLMGSSKTSVVQQFKNYEKTGGEGKHGLTPFEYAMVKSYIGTGYKSVNSAMRKPAWDKNTQLFGQAVQEALKKLPSYNNKEIYRGAAFDKDMQSLYKVGNIVPWNGFSSCGKEASFGGNTQFIIKTRPENSRFRDLLFNPHEAGGEVLGMHHTQVEVTKVEGSPGGHMKVWVNESGFQL